MQGKDQTGRRLQDETRTGQAALQVSRGEVHRAKNTGGQGKDSSGTTGVAGFMGVRGGGLSLCGDYIDCL